MTDPYSDGEIGGLGSGPRYPIGATCTRGVAAGALCPRPAEVRVHLVDTVTGETNRRDELCPAHGLEAALLAFPTVDHPRVVPLTVILAPL